MSRRFVLAFPAFAMLVFLLAACVPVEFSPDGKHIIFCWSADGRSSRLFTMNTDGTQLKALPGGAYGVLARWSPNGNTILFGDDQLNMKVYDTETSKVTQVGANTALAFAWKEDSRQFAALYVPAEGTPEMRRYRWPGGTVESRTALPLRMNTDSFSQMTWLRGREEVAFLGTDANYHSQVYIVSDMGFWEPSLATDVIGLGQTGDGRKLIWACAGANLADNLLTLYQFDAATARITRLPFPAHLTAINSDSTRLPEALESVVFSPDGRWMALIVAQPLGTGSGVLSAEGGEAVYVVRMDGTAAHLVQQVSTETPGNKPDRTVELLPSWSHDGKCLAVLQWDHSRTSISLYNADGSGRMRLPLPDYAEDALIQRLQMYVSRHYTRTVRRPSVARQMTGQH